MTDTNGLQWIPAQTYTMGSDRHYPEEGPAHRVTVDGFWIEALQVTNAQFAEFVRATDYLTIAERPLDRDSREWSRACFAWLARIRHEFPPVGAKIRREGGVAAKRRGRALKHFDRRALQALVRKTDDREQTVLVR